MVQRITGQAHRRAGPSRGRGVRITDQSLLGEDDEPAVVVGYGPVPAGAARDLVARAERVALRRLLTEPATGQLVAMEARSRDFPRGLRRFLRLRDLTCRRPWCDAPVRHSDHVVADADGGEDECEQNGQGLCESCNYTKGLPGWRARGGTDQPTREPRRRDDHPHRSRLPISRAFAALSRLHPPRRRASSSGSWRGPQALLRRVTAGRPSPDTTRRCPRAAGSAPPACRQRVPLWSGHTWIARLQEGRNIREPDLRARCRGGK